MKRIDFVGTFATQRDAYASATAKSEGCVDASALSRHVSADEPQYSQALERLNLAERGSGLQVLLVPCDPGRGVELAYLPTFVDSSRRVWSWPQAEEPFWYTRSAREITVDNPVYDAAGAYWRVNWSETATEVPYDDCASGKGECDAVTTTTQSIVFVSPRDDSPRALWVDSSASEKSEDIKTSKKRASADDWSVRAARDGVHIDSQVVPW